MNHRWNRWPVILILGTGILVYWNSFQGVFMFDDIPHILFNLSIRTLRHPWALLTHWIRPLVTVTLAVNYSLHGLNIWGYHLFNLAIHLLATFILFGILRRTFQTNRLKARYGHLAHPLALSISLIWMVHPLQTESVTYIIQRGESMMGLFYLLTLYCVIRSTKSTKDHQWQALTIASCVLGMASKPTMATAPLLVLWYDRVFLSSSWRELFQRRLTLYLSLASCWVWLASFLLMNFGEYKTNAGFWMDKISPWQYALTQPGVILHYLKLSIWPRPLLLDYQWPIARGVQEAWPS